MLTSLALRAAGLLAACGLAVTAVAAPARADVVVDCSAGPVVVSQSNEVVEVVGTCSTVTVTAVNSLVRVASAARLALDGSNNQVSTGDVGVLDVVGDNNVVTTRAVDRAQVSGSNGSLDAASIGRATLVGDNGSVTVTGRLGVAIIEASNGRVEARTGHKVVVRGSNYGVRFVRLDTVVVTGSNNGVRVAKGSTRVRNSGPNSGVEVHRRR